VWRWSNDLSREPHDEFLPINNPVIRHRKAGLTLSSSASVAEISFNGSIASGKAIARSALQTHS
jgi:hypothetical protein